MFKEGKESWKSEREALRALLTEEEYEGAQASTLNAHFTSPDVVRGMWDTLDRLGFKGGLALEPAVGVGHFLGMIPDKFAPKTAWTATELDPLTGRIAKTLYGGAEVGIQGFETLKRPSNYYDLAISNVPFGDYTLREKPYGAFPIHNFFFVKSLDKVRPGGMVAFITSKYSMDEVSSGTRELLAKTSDLVGAIRLPGGRKGAFAGNAGTAVTTDILFLRKKIPGETPFPGEDWMGLREIQGQDGPVKVNEYFAKHPEMMLGEMNAQGGGQYGNESWLSGSAEGLRERIAEASMNMPAGALMPRTTPVPPSIHGSEIGAGIKDGAYFIKDGALYQRQAGQGYEQKMSATDHDKVKRLVGMRDTVNDLLAAQLRGESSEAQRKALRDAYDSFVDKHGPINKETTTTTTRLNKAGEPVVITRRPNFDPFREDPDAYKVAAIEHYDAESGKAKRANIQTKDVIDPPRERQINGPSDALAASLNDKGAVDFDHIAESLNLTSHDEVVAALGDMIYQDPNGRAWDTADKYLSGNVVQKLEEARAIAQEDPSYLRNVAALEKVQPTPLTATDITAQFGAPWVPGEVYGEFIRDVLGGGKTEVVRVPITGEWRVGKFYASRDAQAKFGTDSVDVRRVVEER